MDGTEGQDGKKAKPEGHHEELQPPPEQHTAAEAAALEASLVGRETGALATAATIQGAPDPAKLLEQYHALVAKQQNGECRASGFQPVNACLCA